MSEAPAPVGVVLAGGAARRMPDAPEGGKAYVELGGRPLLQHVLDRLGPQVRALWLSVPAGARGNVPGGVVPLPDRSPSPRGPLAGLATALARLCAESGDWLVLAPCDTPFLPRDLVRKLLAATEPGVLAVAAADPERVHPACSLWHRSAAPTVEQALEAPGGPGLMALLEGLEHRLVRWDAAEPPPFHNINTPGELQQARAWLERP